ncbi:DUF4331 family protein [Candidatus Gracilibacteria bacterium]|nr:DUF4331 family protein [Candidatus Gracilibacteria bacterium]
MKQLHKKFISGTVIITLILLTNINAFASSHREAPMISGDPKVDATDLYAFVSPDKTDTVTLIANYIPFEEPAGGPNFDSFDDKALYEINVDNNGDAKPDIVYQFRFKTTVGNPNTFLYNVGAIESLTDPDWNVRQTYTLTKVENGESSVLGTDLMSPPVNIGPKSTPNYAGLQTSSINILPNGIKVFAGQSADPFFVDLGATFDLLTIRKLPGNVGKGVNTTKGFNVHSLALQIPTAQLTKNKVVPTDATSGDSVIGVWTTASRMSTRVLNTNGTQDNTGPWVQVSRLGAPLVNEVVVPLGAKDLFNGSKPENDAQFANGVTDPELGKLLLALYNIKVPPQGAFGSTSARDDLVAIFLTGIPQLTQPMNVVPSEQLRLNVAIAPTASPNRLGVLGGDAAGYPNGRRLTDDVIDISLQAVAGAAYPLFHTGFVADATGLKLGDGVDKTDSVLRTTFPYMGLPNRGFESIPHGNYTMKNDNNDDNGNSGNNGNNGNLNGNNGNNGNGTVLIICNITKHLEIGYKGRDIRCLQQFLKDKGFLRIKNPTEYFGELTKESLKKWQTSADQESTGYLN